MLVDPKWNDTLAAIEKPKPQPPQFSTWRWHSWTRLDIRPVLWSLRNRPEEWEVAGSPEYPVLNHKPSGHLFHYTMILCGLANGHGCSCERFGTFSWTQTFQFRRAAKLLVKARKRSTLREVNKQFTAHFLPDAA